MSLAGSRGAADGPGVRAKAVVSPGEAPAPVLAVPAVGVHGVVFRCCSMPVRPSLVTAAARTRMPTPQRRAASLR
jgi:hypothetical protein